MDITTVFGTVVVGSSPTGSTRVCEFGHRTRKPEHDGARRGSEIFTRKILATESYWEHSESKPDII